MVISMAGTLPAPNGRAGEQAAEPTRLALATGEHPGSTGLAERAEQPPRPP
jgi:hypothetical protein